MSQQIADRYRWTFDIMDIAPSDRVLELGCGNGTMASLICERLTTGHLVGIDRSATMIARAEANNRQHIASGRASFHTVPIDAFDPQRRRFDVIVAINVNVFWMEPRAELAVIGRALTPEGSLFLVTQPPSAGKLHRIETDTVRNLAVADLAVRKIVRLEPPYMPMICIVAGREVV